MVLHKPHVKIPLKQRKIGSKALDNFNQCRDKKSIRIHLLHLSFTSYQPGKHHTHIGRSHIPTQLCTLKMTPMYKTIPDNPMQGSLPKKPQTKTTCSYVQIIDAVSDLKKSMQIHKLIALHAHHLVTRRKVILSCNNATQRKS